MFICWDYAHFFDLMFKRFVDGQTYIRTYARTHGRTFETGFIRSTLSKSRPNKKHIVDLTTSYDYRRRKQWNQTYLHGYWKVVLCFRWKENIHGFLGKWLIALWCLSNLNHMQLPPATAAIQPLFQ